MSESNTGASGKKIIHQFTVSRCATSFDPLEIIEGATRQAQAEQVVGSLMDPADEDALNFYYEADHCGGDVAVDLSIWGTSGELVHSAARMLHNRYEGHPQPQQIIEELEVSA